MGFKSMNPPPPPPQIILGFSNTKPNAIVEVLQK